MKKLSRILSFVLITSLLMSGAGCSKKESKKEKSIRKNRPPKIFESVLPETFDQMPELVKDRLMVSVKDSIDALISSTNDDDTAHYIILSAMSYKIDDNSLSYEDGYSYLDVKFLTPDYKKVMADEHNLEDATVFLKALNEADKLETMVTLKLQTCESGWEISNTDEISKDLFGFMNEEINFAPVKTGPDLSGTYYVAALDYTPYFNDTVAYVLDKEVSMKGNLDIYLYLTIDEDTATITLDQDKLMDDIYDYVVLNADSMVQASTGVNMTTIKILSGMSNQDIYDMIMESVMDEVDSINFDLFTMTGPYDIDGDIITIHGEGRQGEIIGTIDGTKINMDISANRNVDSYIDEDELLFELTTIE